MYQPSAVPDNAPAGLKAWLADQVRQIANELLSPQVRALQLQIIGTEPARVRNGMIVYADGAEWNPGSGAGVYAYQSGAWVKL